eukprot:s1187_g18.t1
MSSFSCRADAPLPAAALRCPVVRPARRGRSDVRDERQLRHGGTAEAENQGRSGQGVPKGDGRSFLFDPCSNAWRLEESAAADPSPSPAAEPLALPWSQFNVSFHGDFRIGGIPMLLGDDPERRAKEQQEFADTGSSIWDGAVALAKVLEQQPFLVRGREVLELGAGRGLSGLAAWALGARKVHLTDLPYALEAMDSAVQLTCTGHKDLPKPEVAELDWSKAEEFFENRDTDLDVILAADVVWLMDLVEPLADAIATVAKYHPKVEVLVVHQTRSANVELAFLKAMEARSLGVLWSLPGGPGVELFAEPALRPSDPHTIHFPSHFSTCSSCCQLTCPMASPPSAPLDWPLSQHEKRDCVIRLYDQDVRATDEELEALQAELASVRRAASASTLPAVTELGDAWRGPPGLTHPEDEAEQIAQLRAEIASASATLCRATAALRALERRQQSEDDDADDGPSYGGPGWSRSRSEGPHGHPGILSRGSRGRSFDGRRRVSFDGTSDATGAEPEPELPIREVREEPQSYLNRRPRRSVPNQRAAAKASQKATPRRSGGPKDFDRRDDASGASGGAGPSGPSGGPGAPARRVWMGRRR